MECLRVHRRFTSAWLAMAFLLSTSGAAGEAVALRARLLSVEAQAILDGAIELKEAGRYDEAVDAVERARALWESVPGGSRPEVARCFTMLAELSMRRTRVMKAQSYLEQALALQEVALGPDHPEVAQTLLSLADLYQLRWLYSKAAALYQRAVAILEGKLGPGPELVRALSAYGRNQDAQGEPVQARRLFDRALAASRATRRPVEHGVAAFETSAPSLELADCLEAQAEARAKEGADMEAEALLSRALILREAARGPDSPDVAITLNNLGNISQRLGLGVRAERLLRRAVAIGEATLGPEHPTVTARLNNLGLVYGDLGLHARAQPLLERALARMEASAGKDDPRVATVLNNLGAEHIRQGHYALAEPLLARALRIREAAYGKDHPLVADVLNSLSSIHLHQGRLEEAEAASLRALQITETALGERHPDVIVRLNNLAYLYRVEGRADRARPLLERALAIAEAVPGARQVPLVLENLARVSMRERSYEETGTLLQRARRSCEPTDGVCRQQVLELMASLYASEGVLDRSGELLARALDELGATAGEAHPEAARLLVAMAQVRLSEQRVEQAVPLLQRALSVSERRLRREALAFSSERLGTFLQALRADEERIYAVARRNAEREDVRRLALSATLLLKGRSVEETAETSRVVYQSLNAEDQEAFGRLRDLRAGLVRSSMDGGGGLSPAEHRRRLEDLARLGDALEADLARRSAPLRALTALPPAEEIAGRVAAALDGRVLVELVAYVDRAGPSEGQLRYLALLLFPDGRTKAVDLGPAAPIDGGAARLRDALANRDPSFLKLAQGLHALVFQPLARELEGARRLAISPDGQLGLIPFEVLHDGQRFLVDDYTFTYVTSGKDLLPGADDVAPRHSVVVMADPDFDGAPAATAVASQERSSQVREFFAGHRELDRRGWVPLPGTRREAEMLRGLFPYARLMVGRDASKERLLSLRTPGILHIATHGFFLEDAVPGSGTRGLSVSGPEGGDLPVVGLPDPLLRSGLVLAGATGGSGGARSRDDSLVTALELAGINLWGTQLVVLSACDTGRGEVKLGQGIYGLRRSLAAAGAETVVMSLWKVNDETTNVLMGAFYRELLAGRAPSAALHSAMHSVRAAHPHPHYWAPFVALGRDLPLRGMAPP